MDRTFLCYHDPVFTTATLQDGTEIHADYDVLDGLNTLLASAVHAWDIGEDHDRAIPLVEVGAEAELFYLHLGSSHCGQFCLSKGTDLTFDRSWTIEHCPTCGKFDVIISRGAQGITLLLRDALARRTRTFLVR